MKRIVIVVIIFSVVMSAGISPAVDSGKEKAAVAAAQKWLALVDAGRYSESWKEASGYFRDAVTETRWEQALHAVRTPLGKVIARKLKNAAYRTALPGAPDGEYVVIQFETSFQHKESAIETVTPMLNKDGRWRVSGYYIR